MVESWVLHLPGKGCSSRVVGSLNVYVQSSVSVQAALKQ